ADGIYTPLDEGGDHVGQLGKVRITSHDPFTLRDAGVPVLVVENFQSPVVGDDHLAHPLTRRFATRVVTDVAFNAGIVQVIDDLFEAGVPPDTVEVDEDLPVGV